jgi:type IX secretion system substrate protein
LRLKNQFGDRKLFCPFFVILILLLAVFNTSYSQKIESDKLSLNHPINYNPQKIFPQFRVSQASDTLFVYAVRVQFKPDNNPNTTGDGRFDLSNNYPDSVDAPPHDSLYFLYHLEFLKNYYQKASKGKTVILFQMISVVRNLDKFMYEYSPGENENLRKLGDLFFDTWKSVDSVFDFRGINPERSAFVIFHAGVGRDVDLISQGIIQGQLDLPSVFLGLNTLKSIYGDTTQGYYTNDSFIINNSAIIPEQEFRIIPSSFGNFFLELGMNGILVASIGSRLGLPDLFNTQTGITAIGRFGLMDGQSIFSFSGIFPPEPSAWEKQYLGWVNPILITSNGTYTTRAASLDVNGSSSVYKVLISGKEYFLLENRNRDAYRNGQTVFYKQNGDTNLHTMNFSSDQDGFQNGEIWKLKGSITDVDELDWSLPGLKNDTASYQGGILIWHIDENVIDANIVSNTINNNINHRGVDLEEAKGAQEIGVIINTPFGQFIGDGTYVDYWYNGFHYVPSNIYRNEFSQSTFPSSKSYSNIDSRVCLRNFSTIDSSMTFNYENCSGITNINTFPRFVGVDTSGNAQPIGFDYNNNSWDEIFVNVNDTLFGFRDNGNSIRVDAPNGYLKDSASSFIVAYLPVPPNKYIVGTYQNQFNLLYFNIDSNTSNPNILQILTDTILTTPPLILEDRINWIDTTALFAGNMKGNIAKVNLNGFTVGYNQYGDKKIVELAQHFNGVLPSTLIAIDDDSLFLTSGSFPEGQPFEFVSSPVIFDKQSRLSLNYRIISNNLEIARVNSSPAVGDVNNDGQQEIIFTADDKVFAVNRYGVLIDNFPFKVTGINKISGGCSIADLNGDGVFEIIFGTVDGRVYGYSVNGKILEGFPLVTGKEIKSTPAIINSNGQFGLVVYSTDGYLYGWKTPWIYDSSRVLWRNFLTEKYHHNFFYNQVNATTSGPCLPQDKVYNWPNPVYGNKTNIRYFLNGNPSSVKVKILDLSGELVTTLTGTNNSGFDNEVPWDVSTVQSGIYIGVVELEGGCTESVSIKIAVVK